MSPEVCELFIVIDDNKAMAFKLPKIYPLTDVGLSRLSHAEQIQMLIDGGASLIQLRDKHSASGVFLRDAEVALDVARRNNIHLVINDRVDVALAIGADGVHLGQTDLPPHVARRMMSKGSIIGLSTHNPAQVLAAVKQPVDYVAFGPIFETTTKPDRDPLAGLEGLRAARSILGEMPLVAIGGITPENCHEVFEAGADSVAMIAALLSDPAKIAENMRRMTRLVAQ